MIKVILGGQEFEVNPLPFKQSKAWRQELGQPITDLAGVLANADKIELSKPEDLVRLISLVKSYLMDSPDLIWEALCSYSPAIRAKRAELEEAAFDYEIMDALVEVLKVAYPFGRLAGLFRSLSG